LKGKVILRKPFWYVWNFDRLSLQREKVGIISITEKFELVSSCVIARFDCLLAFKLPGHKKGPTMNAKYMGTPQFPTLYLRLPKMPARSELFIFATDIARDEGRKWNRVQVSFQGFHLFNVRGK
jgi:hypothetical protein